MLSPVELGAMATAGLGGITMMWGNIRGVFSRLESLVIVKAELRGNAVDDFMNYSWIHFKMSPIGVRKFDSRNHFIRPKNRFGRVLIECNGTHITFWDRHKPIFVSLNLDSTKYSTGDITLSFIRGTFNLEKLLIDSVNFYDNHKHENDGTTSRYYVKRCFGEKINKQNNISEMSEPPGRSKAFSNEEGDHGFRPLNYDRKDLGVPTSKTPMENLAYESEVQEFYNEVKRWKESKEWFKDKGLPWRLGAGLFGPPGTGKSSLARAIGQGLDMPIHSYDLTTMDNEELVNNWQMSLNESPCIVLLEDIDRIFDENKQIKTSKEKSPLTLDCLLNCISGVQPSDGILVLVTANDVNKLDPALGVPDFTGKSTRPGRLDTAIYVGILSEQNRRKIAKRILSDIPNIIESTVLEGDGETGAQFESRCSNLALKYYWSQSKINKNKD